jgi:hypothetical protein
MPNTIEWAAMAQISPSAPAPGAIRTMAPNSTDSTPPLIVYFLAQLDRVDDLEDAMHCAKAPMNRIAAMPGHRKVTAPAAMPKRLTTTSHQVGTGLAPPVRADERKHTVDKGECTVKKNQRHQG